MSRRFVCVFQICGGYRSFLELESYSFYSIGSYVFLQCFVGFGAGPIYGFSSYCECATYARIVAFLSRVTSFFSARWSLSLALYQHVSFLGFYAADLSELFYVGLE